MMLAGKQAPAGEDVQERVRISPRDVYALSLDSFLVLPGHRDAVGRILARDPERRRCVERSNLLEPDEAYAGNGAAVDDLRRERRREEPCDHLRLHRKVREDPPPDDPCDRRHVHAESVGAGAV